MRHYLWAIALAFVTTTPSQAQETRIAVEGMSSPADTTRDLDWLAGEWITEGIGGATARETYSHPSGGSVLGHFVQENGEGGVMFDEILQIAELDGSLVYRLKHFNADLTGWEEKHEVVSFPLVAIEPGALYFDGLTVRQAGPDRLLAAVRVRNSSGSTDELVFNYRRASAEDGDPLCPDAKTTLAMNACLGEEANALDTRRAEYLAAALAKYNESPEIVAEIRASSAAFEAYREAECGAVYEKFSTGTIRGSMNLTCKMELTRERTHTIWRNWLTYMDSNPPILPEPPRE